MHEANVIWNRNQTLKKIAHDTNITYMKQEVLRKTYSLLSVYKTRTEEKTIILLLQGYLLLRLHFYQTVA
jgi:hypothetical protein